MTEGGNTSRILAGRYRLVAPLGRGGMGSVWRAEHLSLRSPVAIKLIDPSIANDRDALARFYREAQAAATLRSSHVVQVLDYGLDQGPQGETPFIVMELLEGEPLSARIVREGRLSPLVVADLFTQIARALSRAHEANIVHRDLKPDNVFLVKNDDEVVAKVLDFGIAKAHLDGSDTSKQSATQTGAVLGTPFYMSPEQAEGLSGVNFRTDIWSFGVMAYECLLGLRPFTAPTPAGIILAICAREAPLPSRIGPVPPGFDGWFARACARMPEQRFASVREAAAELRKVCGDARANLTPAVSGALPAFEPRPAGNSTSPPVMATSPPSVARTRTRWVLYAALLAAGAAVIGVMLSLRAVPKPATAGRAAASAVTSAMPPEPAPVPVASEAPPPRAEEPAVFPVASAPPVPSTPPPVPVRRPAPASVASARVPSRPGAAPVPAPAPPPAPVKRKTNVDLGL